jgi:abortive infection bacteriophage resistance protein
VARYTKPVITLDQQLEILQTRGLCIMQPERAKRFLEVVSYFRLSIYMQPFQEMGSDTHVFKPNSEFKQIVDLYAFDRELRLLVMDAIERVEVAVRASLNNHMSNKYQSGMDDSALHSDSHSGSHWYLNRDLFKGHYNHQKLIDDLSKKQQKEASILDREIQKINQSSATSEIKQQRIAQRSKENYPRFYQHHYQTPALMPGWAMTEELSLGSLSHMYQGLVKDADRKAIAQRFSAPHEVLASWLHTLTFVRNCCAHHSRLWNREVPVQPKIPREDLWNLPKRLPNSQVQPQRRIYVVLLLLAHLMRQVSPDSQWHNKVKALIKMHPDVPLLPMGFTQNWQSHIFWSGADA